MKLYLFDTINRYKRYSETLDVKTKICNRPWIVFNDGGEKEVYKFKEDGTINIILSGRVTKGNWEYDPSDKTIIISASDQSYMVHPGMYDDMLLALQVDGTDQCSFLIEENNSKNFAPQTYSDLMLFFEEKEKKALEEEKRIILVKIQEKEREEKDKEILQAFETFIKDNKIHNNKIWKTAFLFTFVFAAVVSLVLYYYIRHIGILSMFFLLLLFFYLPIFLFVSAFYNNKITKLLDEFVNLPQYKDKINNKLLNKLKEVNQLN